MELSDVRIGIDRVDRMMKELFIERMKLADQVARIKAETSDDIYKPEREKIIIDKNSEGVDESVLLEYQAFIRRIMEVSRKYQYGRTLEIRHCFPFAFSKEKTSFQRIAMLQNELYLCTSCSKDDVITVENYGEIAEMFRKGEIDAGIGLLEKVGKGTSDELNQLLLDEELYINDCQIVEKNGRREKIVTFSKTLNVLPEHNRIKLVFVCDNRSGSLSSILSMISDYRVNLTEIHSRPNGKVSDWNYYFYAEIETNLLLPESQALIFQLYSETKELKLLGSYYCKGDFENE